MTASAAAPVVLDPSLGLDRCALPVGLALGFALLRRAGPLARLRLRRFLRGRGAGVVPRLAAWLSARPVLLAPPRGAAPHAFSAVLAHDDAVHLSPAAMARLGLGGDGARVRVFVPLGLRARREARERLGIGATALPPWGTGPSLVLPADAALGLYLASLPREGARGAAPLPGGRGAWTALEPGRTIGPAEREGLRRLRAAQLADQGALRGHFASLDEVLRALDAGELAEGAHVFVRHRGHTLSTVAGRCRAMALLPAELPASLANVVLDRRALEGLVAESVAALGTRRAAGLVDALSGLGLALVTRSAPSLGMDDLAPPAAKAGHVERGRREHAEVEQAWQDGELTGGERYQRLVDLWTGVADACGDAVGAGQRTPWTVTSPLLLLTGSGVTGGRRELAALVGMKGLPTKPSGEFHEAPILESYGEGLAPHGAFAAATHARAAGVVALARGREDRRLARSLVEALGDLRITAPDCGALGALPLGDLVDAGDLFLALSDRIRGRTVVETSPDGRTAAIRSPVFCEAEGGLCAACCGLSPATGAPPALGEPVGHHAALALAAALPRVEERTFHICLCAAFYAGGPEGLERDGLRRASPYVEAPTDGVLVLRPDDRSAVALTPEGDRVVVYAGLEAWVREEAGGLVHCGPIPRGAHLRALPGERVRREQLVAEADQFHVPEIADHDGTVRWVDLVEGLTWQRVLDEVTGLERSVVLDLFLVSRRPRIDVLAPDGGVLQTVWLLPDHELRRDDGAPVARGQTLARRPILAGHVPGVVRGRSDLVRLLQGETPDAARLAEIRGVVTTERHPDRSTTLTVRPTEGSAADVAAGTRIYRVERGRDVLFTDGQIVGAGERLDGGPVDPGDLARILGPATAARFLVDGLQLVLALARIHLPTRHAEIVARALLRFVRIRDAGDGPWAAGELVPRGRFARAAQALAGRGLRPPSGELTVTGLQVG